MTPQLRPVVPGAAAGEVVVLDEALSFWGGFDAETGTIIDAHHPQVGTCLTGRIVVLPAGRGSSSASSVIAEAVRVATAPAALVLGEADEIIATGAIVADELYGRPLPVFVAGPDVYARIASLSSTTIAADGSFD